MSVLQGVTVRCHYKCQGVTVPHCKTLADGALTPAADVLVSIYCNLMNICAIYF